MYDEQLSYDAMGNVTTAKTTLPAGTDNQAFCYDEQDRLTWAGSKGTPSCSTTLTPGTLTAAQYTQSYGYDVLNRLTTGPLGAGYTYGDSTHLDAVTSASGYIAQYDTAGDMSCRAPVGSGYTCTTGNQTGQQLGYDALRRVVSWQNAKTSPTASAAYAYDGEGNRVQQVQTNSGTTTTTNYIGSYEEISTGGTTATKKYYAAGIATIESVNGNLAYLVQDREGNVVEGLTSTGTVNGQQLYLPYGAGRYSTGFSTTDYGYTGQRGNTSGLDY